MTEITMPLICYKCGAATPIKVKTTQIGYGYSASCKACMTFLPYDVKDGAVIPKK